MDDSVKTEYYCVRELKQNNNQELVFIFNLYNYLGNGIILNKELLSESLSSDALLFFVIPRKIKNNVNLN